MTKTQKILLVITKSNWGGAQRYVYDIAIAMRDRGHDVSVAFGGKGLLSNKLSESNIKTIEIPGMGRDINLLGDIRSAIFLWKTLRRVRPDVLHLNSSKAGGTGALVGRLAGVKNIIFTSHGWAFNENRSLPVRLMIKFLQWLTILMSHKTICVSKSDANQVKRWPFAAKKIAMIHNGIGPLVFTSGSKIRDSFPSGVTITGTIGELTKNKNQTVLIDEALRDPSMYAAIVGDGEDHKALEEKIKKNHLEQRVKLFGFVRAEDALKGFDRFALPSIKEGLPYVLLEAKSAGLPIIANRVGGIGEILDNSDKNDFTLQHMVEATEQIYKDGL